MSHQELDLSIYRALVEQTADHIIITDDNPRHEASAAIIKDILAGIDVPDIQEGLAALKTYFEA